jgi:hypothetical protein
MFVEMRISEKNQMNEDFDQETGEIKEEGRAIPSVPIEPKPPSVSLLQAIHAIVSELPIWIKQDGEATITGTQKRKYATLKAIMAVVQPIALKHGVRIKQNCEHAWQLDTGQIKGRMVPIITDLIQGVTGDFERTTVEIPISKMDAQAMGSAISYGRRYGLLLALGLTTDEADDDGSRTASKLVTEQHEDSQELWAIKAEIKECETLDQINKWVTKVTGNKAIENLTEVEAALARAAYSAQLKVIKSGDVEKKK